MDTETLRARLTECADGLRRARESFVNDWTTPLFVGAESRDPYRTRDKHGRLLLGDMLAAEGQVLAALAQLPAPPRDTGDLHGTGRRPPTVTTRSPGSAAL